MPQLALRDHRFLGTTQSLCPDCLALVPAKVIDRGGRVYFRKRCPEHGVREDLICSDVGWFDRMEYSLPGKVPHRWAVQPRLGCPYDCGLCTEHEQHTCIAVLEITSSCNLTCPMCYASSAPGGPHLSFDDCRRAIDYLVEYEGRPEVLQLSGGEPTVHPRFAEIFEYACQQPIDIVMINTNGIRIASDARLRELLQRYRKRCEVYLQFDGFHDQAYQSLRGENLLETKLQAVELLGQAGIHATLVCTVERGVNLDQVGPLIRFGLERSWITGVSFQPATYVGRYPAAADLDQRVTFPDIIQAVATQSGGLWETSDFLPLPCAHPNAHSLAYAYRESDQVVPLTRIVNIGEHLDLLANGITFNRGSARELIGEFLARQSCGCEGGCGPVSLPPASSETATIIELGNAAARPHRLLAKAATGTAATIELGRAAGSLPGLPTASTAAGHDPLAEVARRFFQRCLSEDLSPADVFRITTTSFMDAYNFDIRQLMKSCVHHLLPSGHLIPFCAYNLLYRTGRVPLPPLSRSPGTKADAAGRRAVASRATAPHTQASVSLPIIP